MTSTSIVWTLKERERSMNEELTLTIALGQKLQSKSKSMREKKVKRPSVASDRVEDELKRIAYQLETGTWSKNEEKELMKEQQRVNSSKHEHVQVEKHWNEVNAMSKKADDAFAKVNRLRDALTEIRSAIRQFELCAKIEALHNNGTAVSPGDLETSLLDVPDTSVLGQIIGKRGVGVERLRTQHCIEFDTIEDGETTQIKLTGLPEGIASATLSIQGILNSVSKDVEVTSEVIRALLHNKAARLNNFGDKHYCTVEPKRNDERQLGTTLTIRGLEQSVTECIADILSFQNNAVEVKVLDELIPQVVGSKANVLTKLQDDLGVYINIDRENFVFRIFHEEDAPKEKCSEMLTQLVEDFTQYDDEFEIDPNMASSLIGKGGAKIQQLQKAARCLVTVDRENKSRVVLRGTRKSLEFAKQQLTELSTVYTKEHQSIECTVGLSAVLIARSGEVIKTLEKAHEVKISVDRTTNNISIQGKEENILVATQAINEISASLSEIIIENLTQDEIGNVIGKGGKTITALTKEFKCEINIQKVGVSDNKIAVQGVNSNVTECSNKINDIIAKYRKENIVIIVDTSFLPSFIGKGGEDIKKFRKLYPGVDINIGDRGTGIVKLRGEEELLTKVKVVIEEMSTLYGLTHVEIAVVSKQINLLIGHRGETIKALQKETNCFIDVRKQDNTARVRGETAEEVEAAVQKIKEIIGMENWNEFKLKLPTEKAAAYVVGKKGETIQRLQKEYNCVIEINRNDHHVDIFGPQDSIDSVVAEINALFDLNIEYYQRIIIHEKYVSSIIGRGGANIKLLQTESGADLSVQRPAKEGSDGNSNNNNNNNGRKRWNRDENPYVMDDKNNVVDASLFYIVVRGKKNTIEKGVAMVSNAIAELRNDQMVLSPQHMASLKQQQSTQFITMELKCNVSIQLDMERNTVTFLPKENVVGLGREPQILQARIQIFKLLAFFYPKEFITVELPSGDMHRSLERELSALRVKSNTKMTLVPTSTSYCVLVSGDALSTVEGVQLLEDLKIKYAKNARDVQMPYEMIGSIVGKGGSGIKKSEKEYSIKINIDKKINGLIHLRGEPEQLDIAEEYFQKLKLDYESKFTIFNFDPDANGVIIGKGGATIRKLQEDHSCRIDMDRNVPGIAKIQNKSDDADNLINVVVALKALLSEAGYGEDIVTEEMTVMRQHVGGIVGEGGSVIRELENETKCSIKIRKEDEGGMITLRGKIECIAAAKDMITLICQGMEEEYAQNKADQETQRALVREEKEKESQQNNNKQTNNTEGTEQSNEGEEESKDIDATPRFIPGMSTENQNQTHSMSSQAQKNRRKRERKKAAGKSSGSSKASTKQQEADISGLASLLGIDMGASTASTSSDWNPPPAATQQPPPGFGLRRNSVNPPPSSFTNKNKSSAPPGFSPVPKNNSRKQIAPGYSSLSNTNGNGDAAMMSKLADLGFGASIGGASNNAASTTKPKKYVSARGGYKLRL